MKRKLKLYYLNLKVKLKKLLTKSNKRVGILVSSEWKNKVSDDLLIALELLKNKIQVDLVCYDLPNDYSKYDVIFIRSIWGYEKNLSQFEDLLDELNKKNIKVLNSIDMLKSNYQKEKQLELLDKYDIPHIKTQIIKKNTKDIKSSLKETNNIVIKPCVSASGNNTFLVSYEKTRDNIITPDEINAKFTEINKTTSLMVQPFIKEIDNGELSLIYINSEFTHGILRYPNIFNNKSSITYQDNVPEKALKLAKKVLNIKEYQNSSYARIDMVKIDDTYQIMEVELVEPALFIGNITNEKIKKEVIEKIAKSIINTI